MYITEPADTIFQRLHRRFLAAAISLTIVSLGLGYFGLLTAPVGAICFVVSATLAIVWLNQQPALRIVSLGGWITYTLAFLGTAVVLTFLLSLPQTYNLYLVTVLLFISEMFALRFWKNWRVGSIQLLALATFFILLPSAIIRGEPRTMIRSVGDGDIGHVRVLLALGVDPNSKTGDFFGRSPALLSAARRQDTAMVELLLIHGADPNARNNTGETALFHAARFEQLPNVQLLISRGADVNVRDNRGKTALFSASKYEVAKFLADSGIDIHTKDAEGRTAIFDLAGDGNVDVLEFLLSKGLSLEEGDNKGRTVLFSAVEYHGRPDTFNARGQPGYGLVSFILAQGVNVNHRDVDGRTALDVASENKYEDLVSLLREAGAN